MRDEITTTPSEPAYTPSLGHTTSAAQVGVHAAPLTRSPGQDDAPIQSGAPPTNQHQIVRVVEEVGGPSEAFPGAVLAWVAPLGILTDLEWEKVTIEMAFQRVGQLTRLLAESEARADEIHRARMLDHTEAMRALADMTAQRDAACAARDEAVKAHREAIAAAEQVTRRMEVERDAAVRNCSLTQSRYDALRFENERVTKERDALQVRLGVEPDGVGANAVLELRRPATPEETALYESQLARATCDHMRPTCGQVGCAQCFPPKVDVTPTPLAVGQRWVRVWHGDTHAPDSWAEADFRGRHPRLRLPEELEPAPAPEPAHPKQLCSNCKRGLALAVSMLCELCEAAVAEPDEPAAEIEGTFAALGGHPKLRQGEP